MKAKLIKLRVQNFRSIEDSDWIDTENVSCLVGTNESGKTNLLLALWKLNPANGEPIVPLVDYPRKKYHNYSSTKGTETFISAQFEFDENVAEKLSKIIGWHSSLTKNVTVSRKYNGNLSYQFTQNKLTSIDGDHLSKILKKFVVKFRSSDLQSKEEKQDLERIQQVVEVEKEKITAEKAYSQTEVSDVMQTFEAFLEKSYKRKVNINTFFKENLFEEFKRIIQAFENDGIEVTEDCIKIIHQNIPTFVYYSDYGNLDSEIYLPHVIDNFKRKDLGEKERAKSRSLKVLFEFVNLSPTQILELGKEALPERVTEYTTDYYGTRTKTKERIEEAKEINIEQESQKKKEREILLQSASTSLTRDEVC